MATRRATKQDQQELVTIPVEIVDSLLGAANEKLAHYQALQKSADDNAVPLDYSDEINEWADVVEALSEV